MNKLRFTYEMNAVFDLPVRDHRFTVKGIPGSDARQKISLQYFDLSPKDWLSEGQDARGNVYYYGCARKPHDHFSVRFAGTAAVSCHQPHHRILHEAMRYPTALTGCSGEMLAYLKTRSWGLDYYEDMSRLTKEIYHFMEYTPGVTSTKTSAREAFAARRGVCQDYAHIMIALCRKLGYPALYTAGYMVGEGASHAWVCTYNRQEGLWHEYDPTNNQIVDGTYIHGAYGLDAGDCIFNKGIYQGFTCEKQEVKVIVEEEYD